MRRSCLSLRSSNFELISSDNYQVDPVSAMESRLLVPSSSSDKDVVERWRYWMITVPSWPRIYRTFSWAQHIQRRGSEQVGCERVHKECDWRIWNKRNVMVVNSVLYGCALYIQLAYNPDPRLSFSCIRTPQQFPRLCLIFWLPLLRLPHTSQFIST